MANRTTVTPKKRSRFLAALAEGHAVKHAAEAIGVRREVLYHRRQADPTFAAEWAQAVEVGTEALEQEARRRAVEGVVKEKGVYYQGELVGREIETDYSDTLLIFLLKARAPEKYREKLEHRHTGDAAQPIVVDIREIIVERTTDARE